MPRRSRPRSEAVLTISASGLSLRLRREYIPIYIRFRVSDMSPSDADESHERSKENTKSIIGTEGLQQLLQKLEDLNSPVKTVCIGGLNKSNIARVLWQSTTPSGRSVDGVALVSAIMAAADPGSTAAELLQVVKLPPAFAKLAPVQARLQRSAQDLLELIPEVIKTVDAKKPLSHNMTNLVVQNIAANVALCVGASPIMANYGEEAHDLAKLGGALVVNMGTVTPEGLQNYEKALKAYNAAGGHVVFDPVG